MSLPNQNRRCYLHIGTNKTGSTYIQQAIHGYDDGATYVPRLGRANQSYFLIGAFEVENKRRGEARAARRQFAGAKVFLSSAAHRKKLEAEIKGHRGNVVLSAEALSNHFNSSDAARFVGFLRPHFSRVTAIGYVREPVGLMQSSIQQRVRSGSASLRPDMLRPRYRERLGQWIEVLGRENVTLAMYQRNLFEGGDVLRDFAARTGIGFGQTKPVANVNASLSAEAFSVMFTYGKYRRPGRVRRVFQKRVVRFMRKFGWGQYAFAPFRASHG